LYKKILDKQFGPGPLAMSLHVYTRASSLQHPSWQ